MFKWLGVVVVVVGLAWVYTALYGGPLTAIFGALDNLVPNHPSQGLKLGIF